MPDDILEIHFTVRPGNTDSSYSLESLDLRPSRKIVFTGTSWNLELLDQALF